MSTTSAEKEISVEPAAVRAWAEKGMIYVELTDGCIIGFPADRSEYSRVRQMNN